jgi:hypothetical protein
MKGWEAHVIIARWCAGTVWGYDRNLIRLVTFTSRMSHQHRPLPSETGRSTFRLVTTAGSTKCLVTSDQNQPTCPSAPTDLYDVKSHCAANGNRCDGTSKLSHGENVGAELFADRSTGDHCSKSSGVPSKHLVSVYSSH